MLGHFSHKYKPNQHEIRPVKLGCVRNGIINSVFLSKAQATSLGYEEELGAAPLVLLPIQTRLPVLQIGRPHLLSLISHVGGLGLIPCNGNFSIIDRLS